MKDADFATFTDKQLRRIDQDGRDWGHIYPDMARAASQAREELAKRAHCNKKG